MKKVIITGAAGIIGSVLTKGLSADFSVSPLSRNDGDLRNIDEVRKVIKDNTDVIIHLAWKDGEMYEKGHFDQDNIVMTLNVLEVAAENKIPRVILASSVHANEYRTTLHHSGETQSMDWPTSIYGATKIYIESLGKYYAKYCGLEVVSVRFGGVNEQNSPTAKPEVDYDKIFLSHQDLIDGIKNLIIENVEEYTMIYMISNPPVL